MAENGRQAILLKTDTADSGAAPFKTQLLKWVGSKQKVAHEITRWFPQDYGTYVEPFLGSGAVMATLAPRQALGGDIFAPLMEIWTTLSRDPDRVKKWYRSRYEACAGSAAAEGYDRIRAAYNAHPNGADLLYLSRACYGGVIRFRKKDGHMSTPRGVHPPMQPARFDRRVDLWHRRLAGARFVQGGFAQTMSAAREGDLVYCDPPYADSQSILYGAQAFDLAALFEAIAACKARGVRVALSLDASKKSGRRLCPVDLPPGLFEREVRISTGRSMLRRFQMGGRSLETEEVQDRLLLTYPG